MILFSVVSLVLGIFTSRSIFFGLNQSFSDLLKFIFNQSTLTFLLALIAIFTEQIKKYWSRSNLVIGKKAKENTQNEKIFWRIKIKNKAGLIKNNDAKNIKANLEEILENKISIRKNSITIPLYWTHEDKEELTLHPNQSAFLNILELQINKTSIFKQEEKMITETRYKYLRYKDRSIF